MTNSSRDLASTSSYRVTNDIFWFSHFFNESIGLRRSWSIMSNRRKRLAAAVKWTNPVKIEDKTIFYLSQMQVIMHWIQLVTVTEYPPAPNLSDAHHERRSWLGLESLTWTQQEQHKVHPHRSDQVPMVKRLNTKKCREIKRPRGGIVIRVMTSGLRSWKHLVLNCYWCTTLLHVLGW